MSYIQEIDCRFSFAGHSAKLERRLMCKQLEECKDEHNIIDTLSTHARNMDNTLTTLQTELLLNVYLFHLLKSNGDYKL